MRRRRVVRGLIFLLEVPHFMVSLPGFQAKNGSAKETSLVILSPVGQTTKTLGRLAPSLQSLKSLPMIAVEYDEQNGLVPVSATEIFRFLDDRSQNGRFILLGVGKGGLIAEWITTRVRAAERRIVRVITVNAPFDGLPRVATDPEPTLGVRDLYPESSTIKSLQSPPTNDVRQVDFIRLWQRNQTRVSQESAFRMPNQAGVTIRQLVVDIE